ncbi:MAG: hypothetical protein ABS918_11390 [Saccharopolyspora rectivirgula]
MTSANHPTAPAAELEQLRAIARQWGRAAWAQPCEAIPFRWRKFDLKNFSGRQELGTLPLWYKLCWVFALPFMLVFVLIYGILNELWLAGDVKSEDGKTERKLRPGLIQVRGTTKNSAATALIDNVKKAPRPLWLVFSQDHLAVLSFDKEDNEPRLVWRTDPSARVQLRHAVRSSIEITWPDRAGAAFYPASEERAVITEFLRATRGGAR